MLKMHEDTGVLLDGIFEDGEYMVVYLLLYLQLSAHSWQWKQSRPDLIK